MYVYPQSVKEVSRKGAATQRCDFAPLRDIENLIGLTELPIVNQRSIVLQMMNGLRRKNDAMKNRSWYKKKV